MISITLQKAQPNNTQFLYDLYVQESVARGSGLHGPISPVEWRNIVVGLYETNQQNYIITAGTLKVGYVALQALSKEDKRAEVCIAVLPDMQDSGIGTQALQLILQLAAKSPSEGGSGLHYVLANIIDDNVISKSLFERAMFTLCATIPNYHRYNSLRVSRCVYIKRLV